MPLSSRTSSDKWLWNCNSCIRQMPVVCQCYRAFIFDPPHHVFSMYLLYVRLLSSALPHLSDPVKSWHTHTQWFFCPWHKALSHSLCSFNVTQRAFCRQSKAKLDGLLVTHYYKKRLQSHLKTSAYSPQHKFWEISHTLIKRGSNANQHGISFCVALKCVIKCCTFPGQSHPLSQRNCRQPPTEWEDKPCG